MLAHPNDDDVHVSYRIAELKRRPPTTPVVYLFGGSGTMEMIRSEGVRPRDLGQTGAAVQRRKPRRPTPRAWARRWRSSTTCRPAAGCWRSDCRRTGSRAPSDRRQPVSGSPLALTSPHLAAELAGRTSLYRSPCRDCSPGSSTSPRRTSISASHEVARPAPITYADHYYTDGPVASLSAKRTGSAVESPASGPSTRPTSPTICRCSPRPSVWGAQERLRRDLLRTAPGSRGWRTGSGKPSGLLGNDVAESAAS